MSLTVNEIHDLDEFMAISEEWNELLAASDCDIPFLRHEWLVTWWNHFGLDRRLAIVVASEAGQLLAALPLMEVRSKATGFVTLLSMTNYHSYRFHTLQREGRSDGMQASLDYLKDRKRPWDLLLLEELSTEIKSYESLLSAARKNGFSTAVWERGHSAYIPISGSWDHFFSSLKAKFRSNLRNRRKRLSRLGDVHTEFFTTTDRLSEVLDIGFAIEEKSWKGDTGTAIACNPTLVDFYKSIAQLFAKRNWLRLSLLKAGDCYVAFDYSIVYRNVQYCMKIGYDPKFRQFSVGQQLCHENVKRSFDEGHSCYDFLGEMTTQKRDWTSHSFPIAWAYIHNRTLRGYIHYFFKFVIRSRLARIRNMLR